MNQTKIKQELFRKQQEIEERLSKTHKHIYQKDEPVSANFHDQIVQTESDQVVQALEVEGLQELRQIKRALERIENGEYLKCSQCGKVINEKRLEAIPYTEYCIDCA